MANDGTLVLCGVLPGAVSVTLANWSTVASGSEMTGVWNMTFAGAAASGTANLAARIVSVTKTSALVASELAMTAR